MRGRATARYVCYTDIPEGKLYARHTQFTTHPEVSTHGLAAPCLLATQYRALYIDRYTRLNPAYTTLAFSRMLESATFATSVIREGSRVLAHVTTFTRNGVLTGGTVGYDTGRPPEDGLYRAIVALILYALLPVLRNTLTGILSVDRGVRESAVALGMTGRQILWGVELPLAFPTILAGVRIATVTTIGTATIAAAIGGGGLGVFVFRGISMADTTTILAGAVPAALMAIVADEALGWIERRVSYWR